MRFARGSSSATRSGARARRYIPNDSGTTVISSTLTTTPSMLTSSLSSVAPKCDVESSRNSGTVTTAATLETAVIVTDRAVSPRARCVSMFAIVPPGEAPKSTSPTASAGSSE